MRPSALLAWVAHGIPKCVGVYRIVPRRCLKDVVAQHPRIRRRETGNELPQRLLAARQPGRLPNNDSRSLSFVALDASCQGPRDKIGVSKCLEMSFESG